MEYESKRPVCKEPADIPPELKEPTDDPLLDPYRQRGLA